MKECLLILLWFFSFAGYLWFFADRCRLPAAFAPLAAMGSITAVLYAAGLAGFIGLFAWVVVLLGAALSAVMLLRRSRALLQPELLLFVLGCAALWLRYRSSLLTAYDDFSHWGMIVRHMLAHNRLPEAQDALIVFQSYPPGAACWMYYACRFLGGTDGMMLTAQAAWSLAGWLPLFAFARGRGWPAKALAAGAVTLAGLSMFQGTASLMVDNLLAALAVGTVCMLASGHRNPWITGVLAAVIALVKDSGLFFSAVILLYFAFVTYDKTRRKAWFRQLIRLSLPLVLARLFWYLRITLAFPAANVSRHALTLENLRATGSDKSYADMFRIAQLLMARVFSPDNQALQILLILLLVMTASVLLRRSLNGCWQMRCELTVWLSCAAAYAVWVAFMGLMYVFSMTLSNALQLVAFERYNSTCALFLYGMMVLWLCRADHSVPPRAASCLVLAALLPLAIPSWTSGVERLFRENYFVPLRSRMEQLSQLYTPAAGEGAAVLVSAEDDSVYADYMARYVFQDPHIEAVSDPASVPVSLFYAACADLPPLPPDARVIHLPD